MERGFVLDLVEFPSAFFVWAPPPSRPRSGGPMGQPDRDRSGSVPEGSMRKMALIGKVPFFHSGRTTSFLVVTFFAAHAPSLPFVERRPVRAALPSFRRTEAPYRSVFCKKTGPPQSSGPISKTRKPKCRIRGCWSCGQFVG